MEIALLAGAVAVAVVQAHTWLVMAGIALGLW